MSDPPLAQVTTAEAPIRRVALMITELRPGGAERVVAHLAAEMRRRGIEASVLCMQRPGELAADVEAAGATVHAINSLKGYDLGAIRRLRRLIRGLRPDALHVHDYSSLPYAVLGRGLCGGPPIVFTGHGLLFSGFEGLRRRHRFFKRWLARLTAVSEEVAARHREHLAWRGPVEIIPNGVPDCPARAEVRDEVRRELAISEDTFVFLSVGNARAEKGFEDLLDAAAVLRNGASGRPYLCLVAGKTADESYGRMLADKQVQLGLSERVRFLGFRDDAPRLYRAADAFLLSSRSEGLPMVVLESMMAELPIIATRVGGVPAVLADDCGLLTPPREPASLAEAMARVMADDSLRARLAANGRAKAVAQYGLGATVDRYLALYAGCLGRAHRRASVVTGGG